MHGLLRGHSELVEHALLLVPVLVSRPLVYGFVNMLPVALRLWGAALAKGVFVHEHVLDVLVWLQFFQLRFYEFYAFCFVENLFGFFHEFSILGFEVKDIEAADFSFDLFSEPVGDFVTHGFFVTDNGMTRF